MITALIIASKPADLKNQTRLVQTGAGVFEDVKDLSGKSCMSEALEEFARSGKLPLQRKCWSFRLFDLTRCAHKPGLPHIDWNGNALGCSNDGIRFHSDKRQPDGVSLRKSFGSL